ncbi:hypothetical protein VFPPC_11390 [Pochonia chlamydosporia 170]|uniref:Uncharacterized protein n=1 Tax=Pochonia chlamydosporia 170 TaxID=1380566 RepID=A0A179EY06_METCM|nr:hypothetical protein VFPPC_11390 [Pochonia chlamydosporia 170]OAQ58076.1 hypothetical protein VFPPC_11390 [Pochonia chlamydosporia 170]
MLRVVVCSVRNPDTLLALTQDMIQDRDSMTKDRERVFTTRRCRESISRAWEANRRHVAAISNSRAGIDYGARKEVTFCLGTILKEWSEGHFDPDRHPHTGPRTHIVPAAGADSDEHCPFWIVPTKDMNDLIFTQAARLILPLDHLFLEAKLISNDETSLCNTGEQFVRRLFALYTAQLLCRLLIYTFSSERELNYDKWIWYPTWRVKKTDGLIVERCGLGLDEQIDTSGMLWLPHETIDWRRGHIALENLIELYIPRSPLQARLTSQTNIQGLTTTQLTVEYVLQEWVQEAKRAFKERRDKKGNELAERVIRLSAEEIAREYNRHLLAKMQAYWDRVRSSIGRDLLPALTRLQEAQENVVAERSRIVTAQTIWEIYQDAWAVYAKVVPDEDDDNTHMPMELPCWMTTRKYQPPKHNWTDFLDREVFFRPAKPKWNKIYFLKVLRTFRRIWCPIKAYAGRFEQHIKPFLGRSVMVTFNCNQAKEVGTSRTPRTWYHGKPSFFQMQYWAPYFSPPEDNRDLRVESGPNWGNEDQLDYIVPWQLGTADAFRVPLPPAVVAKAGSDSLLSTPTILLPTRDAVVSLLRKIRSCPGLTEGVKKRLKWARRRLDNDGHQYAIPSHLEAKAEAAELTTQSPSLLRQFLAQTEPPERQIFAEDIDEAETGSQLFVREDSQSEPEPESGVESETNSLEPWDELAGTVDT